MSKKQKPKYCIIGGAKAETYGYEYVVGKKARMYSVGDEHVHVKVENLGFWYIATEDALFNFNNKESIINMKREDAL
ncbi:hypothetical protein_gp247 [Bacillus phage vB_BceM_WH1]|nr:hypothetical protein_gp247 [Bacillus phage vB_BceM_WH1]